MYSAISRREIGNALWWWLLMFLLLGCMTVIQLNFQATSKCAQQFSKFIVLLLLLLLLQCVWKKATKMFLVISPTKLVQFWNLVHGFLNKFAIKWCKRFSPYLNVSTLPCKTWNARCACAIIELIQKETPEFIPLQLWPPNSPDLNPVDYRVWEISQEKM